MPGQLWGGGEDGERYSNKKKVEYIVRWDPLPMASLMDMQGQADYALCISVWLGSSPVASMSQQA
jgi:hypothetical protein